MKKAQLPNGQLLVFPEDTSDKVIQATVKRIANAKTDVEWSPEHVKELIKELTASQGELDFERAKIDFFGPAIDKQTKNLNKQNQDIIRSLQKFIKGLVSSQSESSKATVNGLAPFLTEIVGQLIALVTKYEVSSKRVEQAMNGLAQSVDANTKATQYLGKQQTETNQILRELVKATKANKKIIRDDNGHITEVKNS